MTKKEHMQDLINKLNKASDAYYNGEPELMTDHEWDEMFDSLKSLEDETGIVLPDSPTHKVLADHIPGAEVRHEFPALSLAKTKSISDLEKWAKNKPAYVSWKLDGASLISVWDNGKLSSLESRGDGFVGTDLTHLAGAIGGIPSSIKYKGHLVVRGEALISYSAFNDFCLTAKESYANPRNLCSAAFTLKNVADVKERNIQYIVYTLVHNDEDDTPDEIPTWNERLDFLAENGFNVVPNELIMPGEMDRVIKEWTDRVDDYNYPVDGLVITHQSHAMSKQGEATQHHFLNHGFAYKFFDESKPSRLERVLWNVAPNQIVPIAQFSPIEIEGTQVSRATLCNLSECERLGITDDCTVNVAKMNKIIPKVISVDDAVGKLTIPAKCPACGHDTEIRVSDSGTKTLVCVNPDCPAKKIRLFERFASKSAMNMDGISTAAIQDFVDRGWIKEFADFYKLKDHKREISAMSGYGAKSTKNILDSIEKSRTVTADKLLYALSIPLAGADVCKKIVKAYPDFTELFVRLMSGDLRASTLQKIDGLGEEKSRMFVNWWRDEKNQMAMARLMAEIFVEEPEKTGGGEKCKGLTFVVTGDVHHYKNRKELQSYIESQGGKVVGSVSKKTDFLINNDVESSSSKNQKAKALNVPIISEDEFIERFG